MPPNQKPIPIKQPWTEAFWEGTLQGKLLIQNCSECGSKIFFPKKLCPDCWSETMEWSESTGKATVYSFTVMKDMVEPVFMGDLPYVLAMVDLDDGIRMTTRIVNCKPENVSIGMQVQVVFEDLSPQCALPVFEPVDEAIRTASKKEDTSEDTTTLESSSKPGD